MNNSEDSNDHLGTCALCDAENIALRESHSIPKFVYQWLKDTSATPFMRSGDDVNVRHQDGPKEYLLCDFCEGKLSFFEDELAEKLFKKVANYRRQAPKIKITEEIRVAVISIFWRAILTSKNRDNDRTVEDGVMLQDFLDSVKGQVKAGRCDAKIYFTPFFGDPPYYGLPLDMTYEFERMIGGQDIRFFDDPHRFFVTFKLPFMYFHVFSEGWLDEEVEKSTPLVAGELDVGEINEIPDVLRNYIKHIQRKFEESKPLMSQSEREKIIRDAGKSLNVTGSDKSMARAAGISLEEFLRLKKSKKI